MLLKQANLSRFYIHIFIYLVFIDIFPFLYFYSTLHLVDNSVLFWDLPIKIHSNIYPSIVEFTDADTFMRMIKQGDPGFNYTYEMLSRADVLRLPDIGHCTCLHFYIIKIFLKRRLKPNWHLDRGKLHCPWGEGSWKFDVEEDRSKFLLLNISNTFLPLDKDNLRNYKFCDKDLEGYIRGWKRYQARRRGKVRKKKKKKVITTSNDIDKNFTTPKETEKENEITPNYSSDKKLSTLKELEPEKETTVSYINGEKFSNYQPEFKTKVNRIERTLIGQLYLIISTILVSVVLVFSTLLWLWMLIMNNYKKAKK